MEFFATIGVFAIVYFLITRLITWAKQNAPPESADLFNLDTSGSKLFTPVFELLPVIENPTAIEFNLLLEKISSYARLYYYLKDVYVKDVPENTFGKEHLISIKVYETEIIRRDLYQAIFGNRFRFLESKESFTDDERKRLIAATDALRSYANSMAKIYNTARKACTSSVRLSKCAQVDRLYRIRDAEAAHFEDSPSLNQSSEKSFEAAMKNVFKGPH